VTELMLKMYATSHCGGDLLFGIPRWSKGLDFDAGCNIINFNAAQIWLVVANVVSMLLGAAGLLAVIFFMVGGFMFIYSRGEPDATKRARDIMLNSFWGIVIAILASTFVSFVAGRFS
jgi:type IV secretion system pilin